MMYSHDTLPFQYGDHPSVNSLKIEDVPDSTVTIIVDIKGLLVVKTLPFGQKNLVYELRPGNRGQMGLWYRGDKAKMAELTVSFIKTERPLMASIPKQNDHTYNQEDSVFTSDVFTTNEETAIADTFDLSSEIVSINDTIDEDTEKEPSIAETKIAVDTLPSHSTNVAIEYNDIDVWTALNDASFEFDRVRLLRRYFTENGCTKEDVFRALKALRYDPSRLELCRYLVDICKSELKEWQSEIAETFFVYPHFRREFNNIL